MVGSDPLGRIPARQAESAGESDLTFHDTASFSRSSCKIGRYLDSARKMHSAVMAGSTGPAPLNGMRASTPSQGNLLVPVEKRAHGAGSIRLYPGENHPARGDCSPQWMLTRAQSSLRP